jgi:hypothetical protein
MTALAAKEDLADRLGRELTTAEANRADALLADASALVRAFTGQEFSGPTEESVVLRGQGAAIRLPQRPVTAVTSVVAIGGNGLPDVALVDWIFDGIDTIRVGEGSFVINMPAVWWDDDGYPGTFRVDYTHGYTTVPADVVAVVCGMVLRTLTAPTMAGGVRSETIGPYSYQLDAAGTGLSVMLTQADRDALKRYRQTAGMIAVRQA